MTKRPRLLSAASYLSRFNIQLNNSSHWVGLIVDMWLSPLSPPFVNYASDKPVDNSRESDLLSDIHSRQWVVATGSFSIYLDTTIKAPFIKRHQASSATHCYVFCASSYFTHAWRYVGNYMVRHQLLWMPVVPSLPHSRSALSCCLVVRWEPNVNVHISLKDNRAICFIRSYNTPVVIRLSSGIGFSILCWRSPPQPTSCSY